MDAQTLINKAEPIPFSGCLVMSEHGGGEEYSYVTHKGKKVRAHRLSYEFFKGPIQGGLFVCHACDVPCCINPDHLFLGTHLDNMKDKAAKGRASGDFTGHVGERARNVKLRATDVLFIRSSKLPQQKLAKTFGVSRAAISDIKTMKTWKCI
jgi:hypothetical protein